MTETEKKEIRQFFGIPDWDSLTLKAVYRQNCPPGAKTENEMYQALKRRMEQEQRFIAEDISRLK